MSPPIGCGPQRDRERPAGELHAARPDRDELLLVVRAGTSRATCSAICFAVSSSSLAGRPPRRPAVGRRLLGGVQRDERAQPDDRERDADQRADDEAEARAVAANDRAARAARCGGAGVRAAPSSPRAAAPRRPTRGPRRSGPRSRRTRAPAGRPGEGGGIRSLAMCPRRARRSRAARAAPRRAARRPRRRTARRRRRGGRRPARRPPCSA